MRPIDKLVALGYISYELDEKTKKLTYCIKDWAIECTGRECENGVVYTTDGYGFLCLPRDITQRLVKQQYIFDEADAWDFLVNKEIMKSIGERFRELPHIIIPQNKLLFEECEKKLDRFTFSSWRKNSKCC